MTDSNYNQESQQKSSKSSKAKNPLFWILAIIIVFLNLIPDIIDLILNLLNLSIIALFFIMPIVWLINFTIGAVTFLILLILGSFNFRSIAKRIISYLIGYLAEYLPFVGFLPLRTITVALAIFLSLAEEKVSEIAEEKTSEVAEKEEGTKEEIEKEN